MAKPDQLIKRRGKLGLVKVKVDYTAAREWLTSMLGSELAVNIPDPLPTLLFPPSLSLTLGYHSCICGFASFHAKNPDFSSAINISGPPHLTWPL